MALSDAQIGQLVRAVYQDMQQAGATVDELARCVGIIRSLSEARAVQTNAAALAAQYGLPV